MTTNRVVTSGNPAGDPGLLIDQTLQDLNARNARLRSLWQMTPAQRIAAMRRGEPTLEQCAAWAARYPEQVPLLNGEFEYIAMHTPEVCE